ncbi:MAG: hypothetical protein ACRDOO_16950 [Actinomadura sp.]
MHTPDSSYRSPESAGGAAVPNGYSAPVARLAALAMHLGTRGLDVDVTLEGLVTRDPDRPDTVRTITCRPRPDDAGRLWFFTGTGTPIAEADRIFEAAVTIRGLLTPAGPEEGEDT